MRKLLIIALLALCCGCAGPWTHSYKNQNDFARDNYDCQGEANQRAYNMGGTRYSGNPFIVSGEWIKCMKLKHGWRR